MPRSPRVRRTSTAARDKAVVKLQRKDGKHPEREEYNEDSCKMLNYVTNQYELLLRVFKFLPARDLITASEVCKTWNSASNTIRDSRHTPHWMLWSHWPEDGEMEEYPVQMFANHIFSEPSLCLCFMTDRTFKAKISCKKSSVHCPSGRQRKCQNEHQVFNYVRGQLPPSCRCIVAVGMGVIGTDRLLGPTKEIHSRSFGYSTLLLPKMPGVMVSTFTMDEDSLDLDSLIASVPQPCPPIRGMLLFGKQEHTEALSHIVYIIQRWQEETIPVGGGVFKSLNLCKVEDKNHKLKDTAIVGIIFTGKNVRAASTIVRSNLRHRNEVDATVQELKEYEPAGVEKSLGFMFACVSRASSWYSDECVESQIYRKYFPNTPLLGYFGNGEVGTTSLSVPSVNNDEEDEEEGDDDDDEDEEDDSVQRESVVLSFSTVFVNLYFGSNLSP